jgi:membrane-bound ClpP family serine protease
MNPWLWIVPLQILAAGLLVAEIFLPSAGILTALMAAAALGSLWMAFDISANTGLVVLAIDLVILPIVGWKALTLIPTSPAALRDTIDGSILDERIQALVGSEGTSETELRPVGRIRIGDEILEAQLVRGFLERGQPVRVARAEGGHLFVEPL